MKGMRAKVKFTLADVFPDDVIRNYAMSAEIWNRQPAYTQRALMDWPEQVIMYPMGRGDLWSVIVIGPPAVHLAWRSVVFAGQAGPGAGEEGIPTKIGTPRSYQVKDPDAFRGARWVFDVEDEGDASSENPPVYGGV